jgi:transposase
MDELPDLAQLSISEKDALIRALFAQVQQARGLSGQMQALMAKVAELEGRLAQTSRNSSKPPSSDGLKKPKPKSLRIPGQRPSGGQPGHAGHALRQVADPDRVIEHWPPSECAACHRPLGRATVAETRQVTAGGARRLVPRGLCRPAGRRGCCQSARAAFGQTWPRAAG